MKNFFAVKKINFYPENSSGNSYVDNFKIILGELGDLSFVNPLKCLKYKHFDVSIVNWLENMLVRNNKIYFLGVVKYVIKFFAYKLTSKKIVYVRHNFYPHQLNAGVNSFFAKKFVDFVSSFSDVLVCHSPVSGLINHEYLPHPPYFVAKSNNKKHDIWIIFGRIEKYKNIDEIINIWPQKEKLLIFGNGGDEDYIKFLKKIAINKNIEINPNGFSDVEVVDLLGGCNGVIINNIETSSIVSGAYIYAKSIGAKVIAKHSNFIDFESKSYNNLFQFRDVSEIGSILEACRNKNNINMENENKLQLNNIKEKLWKIIN